MQTLDQHNFTPTFLVDQMTREVFNAVTNVRREGVVPAFEYYGVCSPAWTNYR